MRVVVCSDGIALLEFFFFFSFSIFFFISVLLFRSVSFTILRYTPDLELLGSYLHLQKRVFVLELIHCSLS